MRFGESPLHHSLRERSPSPCRGGVVYTTAFDRAAKLLRSFCSFGGITAMQ